MQALRLLALALPMLLAGTGGARADTPVALWKAFDGRVNFTGTQITLRTRANGNGKGTTFSCAVAAPSTNLTASLSIPTGATVVSAQLYWAGSGVPDNTVTFQNTQVTASRQYTSNTIGGGYTYFSGVADVTGLVKGSGTYNFSGLTVSNGDPWCDVQGVLGGFSLLVVYSHSSQPERVLNVYEGFQHVRNGKVEVNASNFRWANPVLPVKETARVGHISWEGDGTLAQDGERLVFEGTEVFDTLNPAGNQFNSSSNINNSNSSYGIDFDAYDTSVTMGMGHDAVVTTVYETGQDMVLLNAEILVVPTLPVSDLAIKVARAGALKIGTDVDYTVTVTNNGPYTESGTITAKYTLPEGMAYVAATATGWSCSASLNAGTCTYTKGLAPGAGAPTLMLRARVTTTGQKVFTVTVEGKATDDNLANNTASDSDIATNADGSTTAPEKPPAYVFTDGACKANVAIGATGQCTKYAAATVGGRAAPIFVTAVDTAGMPVPANSSKEVTASLEFMLECINPAAGSVKPTYAGTPVPVCAAKNALAAWSAPVAIAFPKGAVSVSQSLVYADIGKIRLNLRDGAAISSTEVFVSAPAKIGFRRISYGGFDNPKSTVGSGTGFAPAGAVVKLEIGALLDGNTAFAPNFGNESPVPQVALSRSAIAGVALDDLGALTPTGEAAWAGGTLSTGATWSEVGAVHFAAGLSDPDKSGDPARDNLYFDVPVLGSSEPVGRFYPAYFKTEASGPFDCPAASACVRPEKGAAFSGQPFNVTVEAYGALNQKLKNFKGAWFKPVNLHAVQSAGGALLARKFTPLPPAVAGMGAANPVTYVLESGYQDATPRATTVSPPTMVHARATATESTVAGNVEISSQRSGEVSDEGGILVLSGRTRLPNAIGSDLLQTPLALRAEYWSGAGGWLVVPGYAEARPFSESALSFSNCSGGFLDAGACKLAVLGARTPQTVEYKKGGAVLWLRAPGKRDGGAATSGRFSVKYDSAPWLPSTTGRVTFGSHRSPLIYVREMYF